MSQPPWTPAPTFTIDFDRPWDDRYDSVQGPALEHARDLLAAIRQEFPPAAVHLAPMVNLRTGGRFATEVKAAAQHAGVEWEWLLLANVSYDLAMSQLGCSTAVLATPDGPVVARNMDWWPEHKLAAASCLLHVAKAGRTDFSIAGWPGAIGVATGLSARGFALVLNAVWSDEGVSKAGYPVLLFLRTVLEDAAGFDQAIDMLTREKLAAGALLTVAGTTNDQRVVIERTPSKALLRRPAGDEPLLATNHYRLLRASAQPGEGVRKYFDPTCSRYDALKTLTAPLPTGRTPSTETLLELLSHPAVMQPITAQQMVIRPSQGALELFVPRRLLAGGEENRES